ncbi:MAG TPA: O-antigen ligase family protein, partial [Cerasibacillus sp.]|uniref:O-antigen ligase family protein n=1 Tax=Cerasibacillus sp. TaxID=2498711 RepID=UPI002F3FB5A9
LEILEKDLTLSGRITIWDEALQLISKSYVFGYGEIQSARYITVGTAQFNAHNIFLQILLQGGIIFLFLFIVIFIISLRNSRYCRVESIRYYLLLAVFILFNMMVSEVYSFVIIFLLFTLINNGDLYKLSSKKDGQLIAVHR